MLEQNVAKEFNEDGKYIMRVDSPEELEKTITSIITSDRITRIMQALIDASRQEEKLPD